MNGFDTEHNLKVIQDTILEKFRAGEKEVSEVLSSPGYVEIISSFSIGTNLQEIEINFAEGIVTKDQNVFQTLAYGGQFLKRIPGQEDEYINVPPSETLQKYIGSR